MTLIERHRTDRQRFVLASNSWPCGHLTPRPAVTQRFVLSSYSWPCGHLTPRPAVMQRFVLASNSWPCGHFWAGVTPPNPTHLFSRGTNIWPGGQLPWAAAGVEPKFAATIIATNTRPAPIRKPNAAVFRPMISSRLMSLSRPIRRPQPPQGLSFDAIFSFLAIDDNK